MTGNSSSLWTYDKSSFKYVPAWEIRTYFLLSALALFIGVRPIPVYETSVVAERWPILGNCVARSMYTWYLEVPLSISLQSADFISSRHCMCPSDSSDLYDWPSSRWKPLMELRIFSLLFFKEPRSRDLI